MIAAAVDRDVGCRGRRAGAVDHRAAPDDQVVVGHLDHPLLVVVTTVVQPAQRGCESSAATAPCHTLDVVAPAPARDGTATPVDEPTAKRRAPRPAGDHREHSGEGLLPDELERDRPPRRRDVGCRCSASSAPPSELLLEVMNDRWLARAPGAGRHRTDPARELEDRLAGVADVLSTHYGQPAALAQMQIMLDLSHDPNTLEEETVEAVADTRREVVEAWEPLFAQALGPAANDFELVAVHVVAALRSFIQGNLIATTIGAKPSSRTQRPARRLRRRRHAAPPRRGEGPGARRLSRRLRVRHRQVVERHNDVAHRQRVPALEATGEIQVDPA